MSAKFWGCVRMSREMSFTVQLCRLLSAVGLKLKASRKPSLFACLVLIGTILAWFAYFATHGDAFRFYFAPDAHDTGMDYFNMLANIHGLDPYANNANYPAMCFLVWRVLYHFMPGLPQGGDGFFLRDYMLAQLPYILYIVSSVLVVALCVRHLLRTLTTSSANAVVVALLVSGPLLFTLERGNVILLALASLMLFICFYDSQKKWVRYISYICLAFSAAIKIYPAVFALLVLVKGRHREFVHIILIGMLGFVAPFFAFDGVESIKAMIGGVFLSSEMNQTAGLGSNFSFTNLIKIAVSLFGVKLQSVPSFLMLVPFIICLPLLSVCKATWKKALLLALLCVWVPSFSFTYSLILFIPATVLFLIDPPEGRLDKIYLTLFVLIFLPYALPEVPMVSVVWEGAKFTLSWGCLIVNLVLIIFLVLFIFELFRNAEQKYDLAAIRQN